MRPRSLWGESSAAIPDLLASLNALSLSGIPESLLDKTTVRFEDCEASLREFVEALKQESSSAWLQGRMRKHYERQSR